MTESRSFVPALHPCCSPSSLLQKAVKVTARPVCVETTWIRPLVRSLVRSLVQHLSLSPHHLLAHREEEERRETDVDER